MAYDSEARGSIKQAAIDIHTLQASQFEHQYKVLNSDPYSSAFTYGRKKINEFIERQIPKLPKNARVLDVGCGVGFYIKRFRNAGFEVTGVEPSNEMRTRALAGNPGATIVDGDIESLPFEDGTFDLITAIEVIRYLANPPRALSEIARCLKPGGMCIVTAASQFSLDGYALINKVTSQIKIPLVTRYKHTRHTFFTERTGTQAFERAGFASAETHGIVLGPWNTMGRVAKRLLPTALRAYEPIDSVLSDHRLLRNFCNYLIFVGTR